MFLTRLSVLYPYKKINSPPQSTQITFLFLFSSKFYLPLNPFRKRLYSSNLSNSSNLIISIKSYSNANSMKKEILKDNEGLSGIYQWVNLINKKSYIGSAINLNKRLNEHYRGNRLNIIL